MELCEDEEVKWMFLTQTKSVAHRLKVQNVRTVHPSGTFIQGQLIDTIFKKPHQKQSTLSQVVWHIWTLRRAEVKSKTLILDGKEKIMHLVSVSTFSVSTSAANSGH